MGVYSEQVQQCMVLCIEIIHYFYTPSSLCLIIQFLPCLRILYGCSEEHLLVVIEIVPTCDLNDNTVRCVWSSTILTVHYCFFNAYNDNLKLNIWPLFTVITLVIYDAGLNGLL